MQISSVRAHLLSYALPQPVHLTYHGGERTILKRDAMLIRVEADNGLVGYAPGQGSERAKEGIESVIASFLEGRTLGDPDSAAMEEVLQEAFGRGAWRTDEQIAEYFTGTELVEPGIVPCAQWHPDGDPGELTGYQHLIVAGLGRT